MGSIWTFFLLVWYYLGQKDAKSYMFADVTIFYKKFPYKFPLQNHSNDNIIMGKIFQYLKNNKLELMCIV